MRRSGLPPRTFEDIRQRAYSEGWVYDRYVPDLVRLGKPSVTVVLAQPYAEDLEKVANSWKDDPTNILLWQWPETLFGVFVAADQGAFSRIPDDPSSGFRRELRVTASIPRAELPVYFDFEAAWSRFAELNGAMAYPHGLVGGADGEALPTFSDGTRERVRALVERPFRVESAPGPLRVSPFFLPRPQQGLLEDGAVERRVLLDICRARAFKDRRMDQVAFLHGELFPGTGPEQLFRRLMAMRVTPFLFVTDGARVLLGALSPAPPAPNGSAGRPAVLANVSQFLRGISIAREPLDSLRILVDHRYDRLFDSK